MSELEIVAPAKINLFLRVLRRRADGYHEIQTAFQFLDLCDSLTLSIRRGRAISMELSGDDGCVSGVSVEETNSVLRAARLLQAHCGVGRGAHVRLHKRIPVGGGLGGGSSDAASTLLGLNYLWGCGLGIKQLAVLARYLGADVPVFVHGQAASATGVGEILSPHVFPEHDYLLLVPAPVSTAAVFACMDVGRQRAHLPLKRLLRAGENCCTNVVRNMYPVVASVFSWLSAHGAPQLTGTGGGVFARFASRSKIEQLIERLPVPEWLAFAVRGLNTSPAPSVNMRANATHDFGA